MSVFFIAIACAAASSSSMALTNGDMRPLTASRHGNEPWADSIDVERFLDRPLLRQPRMRDLLALEPPRVDPWMPRAALVALPPAWPTKLRRFRGDV